LERFRCMHQMIDRQLKVCHGRPESEVEALNCPVSGTLRPLFAMIKVEAEMD
jgi:hypothetical protein